MSERLGQLIEAPPARRSRVGVLLNLMTVAMVFATLGLAALLPSTALAGVAELRGQEQIRHCED